MIRHKIQNNVLLATYTTFRIGGPAKFFVDVVNKDELVSAVNWAKVNKQKFFILGGGSNLLVSDKGFKGLVIRLINHQKEVEGNIITVDAGFPLPRLVHLATIHNLNGLTWAAGIPGTVGGAVRGNAGAYGGDMSQSIDSVEFYDTKTKEFNIINKDECGFTYRSSLFKNDPTKIIWQIKLSMTPGVHEELAKTCKAIVKERLAKMPGGFSAGCIYQNIILSDLKKISKPLQKLIDQTNIRGGKLGTGVVIDYLKLKGKHRGDAIISREHANFIVNKGTAKAKDVTKLIKQINKQTQKKLNLELEEEIERVGFRK